MQSEELCGDKFINESEESGREEKDEDVSMKDTKMASPQRQHHNAL